MKSYSVDSSNSSVLETKPVVNLDKYDQSWFDRGRPTWVILLWWLVQGLVFPLTLHNFNGLRCWLLGIFGAKIGKKVVIRSSVRVNYPWKLVIGDYSWIGEDVTLYSLDKIVIGSHCVISQKSHLCTGSHDLTDPHFGLITAPIVVGNGAWIAADCFIAPGVTIGANTVVGARSSVFKSLPENYVTWGNPCIPQYPRKMQQKTTHC